MVEVDGVEYALDDASTNAQRAVDAINEYTKENNIRDEEDNLVQIEPNWANPLYMILYGVGVLVTYIQNLLVSAANSISIAASSERQLLNLADLAMVKRKKASRTTVVGTVYSNLSSEEAVPCVVTTEDAIEVMSGSDTVTFRPAFDITVPIGESKTIIFVADSPGSYSIPANTLAFAVNPSGFRRMVTEASIPGQEAETIQQLRNRLQNRSVQYSAQDAAQEEITQLDGVTVASVYFNHSVTDDQTVGTIVVPPRQALVFVQGYSDGIAEAFYKHMDCQVAGATAPNVIRQDYVTHCGQRIPVYVQQPVQVEVYVRLYVVGEVADVTQQAYTDAICAIAHNLTIGQTLTSVDVIKAMQEAFPTDQFMGCQVGRDTDSFAYKVTSEPYELLTFNPGQIQIIGDQT